MENKTTVYKIAHYYNPEHDKYSVFVESDIDPYSFVQLLGAIHFKYEELVDESACMDERHLICILEKFFGMKDRTHECKKYLPQTQLQKDEWKTINEFSVFDSDKDRTFPIIQIDWYRARESCCTNGQKAYEQFMKTQLPDTIEFANEIQNAQHY